MSGLLDGIPIILVYGLLIGIALAAYDGRLPDRTPAPGSGS